MLKIAIVEDSRTDTLRLRSLLDRFLSEEGISACLRFFGEGAALLEGYNRDYDLIILDIDLPGPNGLVVAQRIRQLDAEVSMCFLTALSQLAPEGYSVAAAGFMVKPVSYSTLRLTLRRALNGIAMRRSQLIGIRQGKSQGFVDARRIVYIETTHKKTALHTVDGELACSEPMKALENRLAGQSFFRIHSAFLVNLAFVQNIRATDVLVDEVWLPLSKHRKQEFLTALASYVGRMP